MPTKRIPEVEHMIEAIGGENRLFEIFPNLEDKEGFLQELAEISVWLSICLGHPDPNRIIDRKASQRTLDKLANKLNGTRVAIEELQGYSRQLLVRRASGRQRQSDWNRTGEREMKKFTDSLEQYETWVREVRVSFNGSSGQPPKPKADEIVSSLAELWERHAGKPPTMRTHPDGEKSGTKRFSPFLTFCEIVIHPIYESYGLKPPSIQSRVDDYLYPSENKE